jgi:hypothetical protein
MGREGLEQARKVEEIKGVSDRRARRRAFATAEGDELAELTRHLSPEDLAVVLRVAKSLRGETSER